MDSVKELLLSAIPFLQGEKLDTVLRHLAEIGVENLNDLNFVDAEKDFDGILRPIEARKVAHLVASLRQSTGNASNLLPSSSTQIVPTAPETSPLSSSAFVSTDSACPNDRLQTSSHGWAEKFEVPWNKMPDEFIHACKEGKRPEKVHLLAAVRVTASEIKKVASHPGKANLSTIARAMVGKYCQSLGDFIPGHGLMDDGAITLTNRFLRQFENFNRCAGNSLRRKLRTHLGNEGNDEITSSEGTRKRQGLGTMKDAYGCVAWQPELPVGENDETQRKKKEWLMTEFQKVENLRDRSQSLQFMLDTYPTQRFTINQKMGSVAQMACDWPYLVTPSGLLSHFHSLMGFELPGRFQKHFATKGRLVLDHAKVRGRQEAKVIAAMLEARAKMLKNDLPLTFGSFLLLCHLLKEDQHLIVMHEETVDRNEMQEKGHLHPHIACVGDDVFHGSCCFVVIDRHALEACDFGTAITVLFAAYYVFNVAYPENSFHTLEFVQRVLADINPARGTKSSKLKSKKVPPAVLRLLSELLTIK